MRSTTRYVCQQCGHSEPKWAGQCPSCGEWNSLVEQVREVRKVRKVRKAFGTSGTSGTSSTSPVRLSSVKKSDYSRRISTKIGELDRVLGGGIVPGSVTLVAGEPGIGKSTLLLQVAGSTNIRCLYVAGEESAAQIAGRASRLGVKGKNIEVLEETNVDTILEVVSDEWRVESGNKNPSPVTPHPSLLIVDSIQTLTTQDLTGGAGSVGQVRESASRLTELAKRRGLPLFMAGHVTKEGTIAGPRVLEHMVDTVLWFEGDRGNILRILRGVKNRFGATDEVGIFSMTEQGLSQVSNPSKLFLSGQKGVAGSVTTVLLEGTRPILVEVQALVVPTKLAFPKRVASGVDSRRLELILAVLTRRARLPDGQAGLPLWDFDVFVNAAGGIKIGEPAADLAIALALASAFQDKPIVAGTVAIGEVGLLGEIREPLQLARRVKEARRLGFRNVASVKEVKTVGQAIKKFVVGSEK